MFAPNEDPDRPGPGPRAARSRGPIDSDRACPWCGSAAIRLHKQMPSWRGPGILVYVIFPIALMLWLSRTTYNVCAECGGRWQRGVRIEPQRPVEPEAPPPPELRAGMYAQQVPSAAVVRRRARLGMEVRTTLSGDVVLTVPPGSCRTCRQAGGRYDARDAPSLPIVGCTCADGCTCTVSPATD
ncbi:MAG TPA: hypothetical protein VGL23_04540 [Chloroflexota bacterium]|jgi:hypothetical protein